MVYTYNTHFIGSISFYNGFQLLLLFKKNQDEAVKIRKQLYKDIIKALKPRMKADNRKPIKSNIFYYCHFPEYKEIHAKIDELNTLLKEDNENFRKFEKQLKDNNQWLK